MAGLVDHTVGDTAGLVGYPGAVCCRAGPVGRGVLVAVVDAASLIGHTGRGVLVAVVDTASPVWLQLVIGLAHRSCCVVRQTW